MISTLKRLAIAGMFVLPFAAPQLHAQGLTPETTVITNTATATFTDANSNAYGNVTAQASVTVGFLAVPNPSTTTPTATPATGSSGNTMSFKLTNNGNGPDNFKLLENGHGGVTVTNYNYNGTDYATLALLNTALALNANVLNQDTFGTLTLTYSVDPNTGGTNIPVTITQQSIRTPATSNFATVTVSPPASRSVSTTPDGATASQLPRTSAYTQTFTVTNTGNSADSYNVSVGVTSGVTGAVTISTVNGAASTTMTTALLAPGASTTIDVTYIVNNQAGAPAVNVPAGTTAQISLSATSTTQNTITNSGDLTVTVIRAAVTMAKVAYKDDLSAPIGATLVLPGQFLQYKITVTNGTGATVTDASNIVVNDVLPTAVTYQSVTADASGWTFSGTSTVTATLSGTLAPGAARYFYIRVKVK
jgi:uncharacterized repeat protein (TIGR01451 family)